MTTGSDGNLILSLIGYFLTFAATLVGTTWTVAWKLSNMKAATDKKIADTAAELRRERVEQTEASRRERTLEIEASARQTGEGMAAIRQKAVDTELWVRDNLVRRPDFQNVIDGFTRTLEGLRADINSNYRELNGKLDRIAQNMRDDRADRDAPHR